MNGIGIETGKETEIGIGIVGEMTIEGIGEVPILHKGRFTFPDEGKIMVIKQTMEEVVGLSWIIRIVEVCTCFLIYYTII